MDDYDALLLVGGRAPEYLRNNCEVIEIVWEFDRQAKWVFAICQGCKCSRRQDSHATNG